MSDTQHNNQAANPVSQVKDQLAELGVRLSLLSHHLSAALGMRTVDLDCLNLIHRHGPFTVGDLARQVSLHPATTTGIVDRLEKQGWVLRERPHLDRRAVLVRALPDRDSELTELLAGMDEALDHLLGGYSEEDLRCVSSFLEEASRRTAMVHGSAAATSTG